jgi:hypothetical protein
MKTVLDEIEEKDKKENLEKIISNEIITKTINFKSKKEFLLHYKTSKKDIIKNSILQGYPHIDEDYIIRLRKLFRILVRNKKIKIDLDSNLPVFNEIIQIMSYGRKINDLLKQYPLNKSTHNGTKQASTSVKDIINTQLSALNDRLNNPYFKIKNESEIQKIEYQIKVLKKCLENNYNDLPEIFNTFSKVIGLDFKSEKINDIEKEALAELLTLFNGSQTSELELLYSFVIYTCDTLKIYNKIYFKKQADSIFNIAYTLFKKHIDSVNLGKSRLAFTYNQNKINKPSIYKTMIENIPIYIYKTEKEQINTVNKIFEVAINSMFGAKNDYEIDLPSINELSKFQQLKNLTKSLKKLNFIPREFFQILSFLEFNSKKLRPPFFLSKK